MATLVETMKGRGLLGLSSLRLSLPWQLLTPARHLLAPHWPDAQGLPRGRLSASAQRITTEMGKCVCPGTRASPTLVAAPATLPSACTVGQAR